MKILIADDHRLVVEAVAGKLATLEPDVAVVTAYSVADLVALLDDSVALALIDLSMPGARGVEHVAQVHQCWPQLKIIVLSGVEELLMEGVADLAISSFSIPGYLGTEMSDVEFIAVAHPDHALHRMNRELSFQDLEGQMQVVIRDSGRQQPRDVGWLGAEQRWTVGSLATAAAFVSSGLGFAWLPRHIIERELHEGVLKQLPLEQGGSRHPTFYLYSNKDKPLGPATQILVELLRSFDTAPLDAPFTAPLQA